MGIKTDDIISSFQIPLLAVSHLPPGTDTAAAAGQLSTGSNPWGQWDSGFVSQASSNPPSITWTTGSASTITPSSLYNLDSQVHSPWSIIVNMSQEMQLYT